VQRVGEEFGDRRASSTTHPPGYLRLAMARRNLRA
jgi:hypothetical protein